MFQRFCPQSKMMIAFLLLMVVAVEPVVTSRAAAGNHSCSCSRELNVVCGYNGVNYTNACVAECSGVFVYGKAFCDPSWRDKGSYGCPANYDPVCGSNGRTYSNECNAHVFGGVSIAHKGECRRGTTKSPIRVTKLPRNRCVCTKDQRPVCGTDGKTYGNACKAACRGVSVARQGKCRRRMTTTTSSATRDSVCRCPMNYDPVCGSDATTYGNTCAATCNGVSVAYRGACLSLIPPPSTTRDRVCYCPANYDPVCGSDGSTYGNTCGATCRGVSVAYRGACVSLIPPPSTTRDRVCYCPANYAPVCGSNGKTYSNSCQAACSGVSVEKKGACRPTVHSSRTADIREPSV